MVLGSNPVARAFAEAMDKVGAPVRLVSLDRKDVSSARMAGLSAHYGSVLDDELWETVEIEGASSFVALTSNDEVNVLACRRVAPLLGRRNVFRVAPARKEHMRLSGAAGAAGRVLLDSAATLASLEERLDEGWKLRATRLTDTFDDAAYRKAHPRAAPFCAVRKSGVDLNAAGQHLPMRPGDVIIGLVPGDDAGPRPAAPKASAAPKEAAKPNEAADAPAAGSPDPAPSEDQS